MRLLTSVPRALPRAILARPAVAAPRTLSMGVRRYSTEEELKKEREAHIKRLEKYYPPSQVKSILAAESMVTPEMWENRQENLTEFAPIYTSDFAKYHELYDFPQHEWLDKSKPWQPIPERIPPGVSLEPDEYSGRAASAINITKLEQLTGLSASYIKSLSVRQITQKRVVNMTRKGKQPSFYSLAIVGDRNGHIGIGEGRNAMQPSKALSQAHWNAVKNLVYIPRFENRTIYGKINHKYHSVLLELRPAPPGHGLRVNHVIYEICKCAGIKDLTGNVGRSRNPMNVAKATIEALSTKQSIIEEIAASRGKKIIDVTNTYYNF
ncbi:small ribosomal subunit protein uS5m [Trichomonascus vanleenenianus]|uniref:mitochondrial 37S ribosomal protein uS5m MRPS5 n=1 Tax=Trichomonascus vanleenenianus TaxID=2268995 RepID=UPI003EC96D76